MTKLTQALTELPNPSPYPPKSQSLDTETATVVPGVVDAGLAVPTLEAGKSAVEDGLDADARPVAGHVAAVHVGVVDADIIPAAADGLRPESAAGLVRGPRCPGARNLWLFFWICKKPGYSTA